MGCSCCGHRCGIGELFTTCGCSASSIPNFSSGDFCFNQHVGAVMLYCLEHGDCSSELLTFACVIGGHVCRCTSDTGCFSSKNEPRVVDECLCATMNDDRFCIVEGDLSASAREIEIREEANVDTLCCCVDDRKIAATGNDEQIRESAAQDRFHRAGHSAGFR